MNNEGLPARGGPSRLLLGHHLALLQVLVQVGTVVPGAAGDERTRQREPPHLPHRHLEVFGGLALGQPVVRVAQASPDPTRPALFRLWRSPFMGMSSIAHSPNLSFRFSTLTTRSAAISRFMASRKSFAFRPVFSAMKRGR